MNASGKRYWFGAKRWGYGWGLPVAWQGWVVLAAWVAVFLVGRLYLVPQNLYAHLAFAIAMAGVLLSICYAKGAPARWRFGDRD